MEQMDVELAGMLAEGSRCRYPEDGRHRPRHNQDGESYRDAAPGHVQVECALCASTAQVPIPDPDSLVWLRGDDGCPTPPPERLQ